MDLQTHLAVLRRFKWIVVLAVLLGTVLAALAIFRVSPSGDPKVEFRKKEVWSSVSTLYITQPGFPEGRTLAGGEAQPGAPATSETKQPRFGDPSRFSGLAVTYSYLLASDEVKRSIGPLPPGAEILNSAVSEGSGSGKEVLPLISIEGRALQPQVARDLNAKAIKALTDFVTSRQVENGIPERERVQISVISPPSEPKVAVPRSYTAGIVLLLLCGMLGVGLAYLLENLRPSTWLDWEPTADGETAFEPPRTDREPGERADAPLEDWTLAMAERRARSEHERSLPDR
jgi:hypothetical protein